MLPVPLNSNGARASHRAQRLPSAPLEGPAAAPLRCAMATDPADRTVVRAACPHDCPDTCAMLVTTELRDGKRVATEIAGDPRIRRRRQAVHEGRPLSRARLTTPIALLHPLKRVGPQGRRSLRARELGRGADGHRGAPASASRPSTRSASCRTATPARWDSCRAKRWRSASSIGSAPASSTARSARTAGAEALNYTLGSRIGTDVEQFQNSKLIVFWGTNAITSNLHLWSRAQEAKRRGAKLIAIDPYRSLTAEKCHEHIALLPGTDAALALGLMHVLMREGWLDERLHRALHARLRRAAERARGVHAAARRRDLRHHGRRQIENLAHDYAQIRPAAIRLNYGMQRARGGGNAVRADRLPAGARRALARCRPAACCCRRAASSTSTARRSTGPICSPGARRARST